MLPLFQINAVSLIGLFAGLLIGLSGVALISRFGHAKLRLRHEEAKAHGTRTAKPSTIMALAKLVAFFVLPALGLALANLISGSQAS